MKEEIKQRIYMINRGEVPFGYKKMESGLLYDKWKYYKLRNLSTKGISNGIFNDPQKVGSGVKLINVVDLYNEPSINVEDLSLLEVTEKELSNYKVKKYDILFTRSSLKLEGIAHCNMLTEDADRIVYDCHIMKMTPNVDVVNPFYLKAYLKGPIARKQIMARAKTTTMTTIGQKDIEDILIAVPPLDEQQKIAEILVKWDELVASQQKLINMLECKRQALIQRLLKPKTNWEKTKIGSIVKEVSLRNNNNCTNVMSVSNKFGFIKQEEQFNKQVASDDLKNYKIVSYGDIAYNPSRINVGSIAIYQHEELGIVSPMYVVFKCTNISPHLLLLILSTSRGKYDIETFLSGSVRDSLNFSDLEEIEIAIPGDSEQESIIKIFNSIDSCILLYNEKLAKLKEQQKAMMQLLLTGIVRVNNGGN